MPEVFCRNCGAKISDIADVCVKCGVATGRTASPVGQIAQPLKSSAVALILTILIPGAGHLYIGRTDKGTPYLIASAIGILCAFSFFLAPISFIIWLVAVIMTAPNISTETAEVNATLGR